MIDAEVVRLRKLRNMALRVRALALSLDSDRGMSSSTFARSALTCWAIARSVTGHLRAHPYLNYQRSPNQLRSLLDRIAASLMVAAARYQKRPLSVCAEQLQGVAHELDDVRALTRSAVLSDTLGRTQLQLRRLLKEVHLAAQSEPGVVAAPRIEVIAGGEAVARDWPYLAI
jgi:hypothetical protein